MLVAGFSFSGLIGGWLCGEGRAGFGASWLSSSWVIVGTFDTTTACVHRTTNRLEEFVTLGVAAGSKILVKIVCCTLGCTAISSSAAVSAMFVSCPGIVGCTLGDGCIGVNFIFTSLFVRAALDKMILSHCRVSRSYSRMLFGL